MLQNNSLQISVASVPYFWSKESYLSFYQALAETETDIVYLGETVCSKRRSMRLQDWLEIADFLTQKGKQVVLSTMTLIEAESELGGLKKIVNQQDYLVEANDISAIQLAKSQGHSFVAGSAINIYNNKSLTLFNQSGMSRWSVPVELGRKDLEPMIEKAKTLGVQVEYQVFGRMPLAYSARCFTARHHQLPKDHCQLKCLDYEQGIPVWTQEGDSFAQINGIQTQSAKVNNLLNYWQQLQNAGINILRIMPLSAVDTIEAVNQLSALIKSKDGALFDESKFKSRYQFCNGYWLQMEGMRLVS